MKEIRETQETNAKRAAEARADGEERFAIPAGSPRFGRQGAPGGRAYRCVLMRAGPTRNDWVLPAEVLRASVAAGLWARSGPGGGRATAPSVFLNHPGWLDGPQVQRLIGTIANAAWSEAEQAVTGELRLLNTPLAALAAQILDQVLELAAPPDVGLSAVLSLQWVRQGGGEREVRVASAITAVWAVDLVCYPAAGGVVEQALAAMGGLPGAAAPAQVYPFVVQPQGGTMNHNTASATAPAGKDSAEAADTEASLALAQSQALLDARLAHAGLPAPLAALVREQFEGRVFRPAELDRALAAHKAAAAALVESAVVQGHSQPPRGGPGGRITGLFDGLDRLQAAYDRLMGLSIEQPELRDTPRLTGIRELYHLVTGDRDMRGLFDPTRAQFANATSSTLAELTRNVLNKAVTQNWSLLTDYRWWERCVAIREFESLRQVSWVTFGGFGDLPTVSEGASYQELTWDDSRETSTWLKKGGYLGLTLEMIDLDDTEKWRAVPNAMAVAALRTLSATVAAVFTQNSGAGPTLSDGVALFHTNHGNLRTTALSAAEWDQVVQAVFKQTEQGSGKRLGIRPSLLLVPIELRKTAVALFTSGQEPGGSLNDVNVAGRDQNFSDNNVIVVPEWTDANDWAALCDPRVAPAVGVGFRFGRTPEVFVAGDPNSHLMFYNDVLPVKVRYFYTVGVIDYRPAHKSNVA